MHVRRRRRVRGVRRLRVRAIRWREPCASPARHGRRDVARIRAVALDGPPVALPCDARTQLAAAPLLLERRAGRFGGDDARCTVCTGDDVDRFGGDAERPAGAAPDAAHYAYDARDFRKNFID